MRKSNFQFINPYLVECEYRINEEFTGEEENVEMHNEFNIDVQQHQSENRAIVKLRLRTNYNEPEKPFQIGVTVASEFEWEDGVDEKTLKIFLNQNAPALLLGYMRPIVANITNSSQFAAYNLPFLNFTDIRNDN